MGCAKPPHTQRGQHMAGHGIKQLRKIALDNLLRQRVFFVAYNAYFYACFAQAFQQCPDAVRVVGAIHEKGRLLMQALKASRPVYL